MKRTITLLLALAMLLSLLTGCGGETEQPWNQDDPGPAPQPTAEEETPDAPSPRDPEVTDTTDGAVTGRAAEPAQAEDIWEVVNASREAQEEMNAFYDATVAAFLHSDQQENLVYSPLNVYFALAMLAETAEGETRDQLLALLDAPDMDTLRRRVAILWTANDRDDEEGLSLLANSIWMNEQVTYRDETLKTLAEQYFASSFSGAMGTEPMNEALRNWINDNTGGLLKDYVSGIETNPDVLLELVSTIYYKAAWREEFYEGDTTEETFHGAKGDTPCDMMHQTDDMMFCRGDRFTAVGRGLSDGGVMYFLLPNEGVSLNDVLDDGQMMDYIRGGYDSVQTDFVTVHMSIPKFDLSSQTDLIETLKTLGVTDAFDRDRADFSNLTEIPAYVGAASHTAKVTIDEQGVTGAAYTIITLENAATFADDREEVEFVLDRPFCYVATAADGSILFAGTVWDLEK